MELFLVIPLIVLVLVAGLEVIGLAKARIELVAAVREGARVAATTPDPSRAVEAVQDALSPTQRASARISVTRPSVVGRPARVVVHSSYRVLEVFGGGVKVGVSADASMLVER